MTDLAETIGRELVTLIRGAKDIHSVLVDRSSQPVLDPPAFGLLARIGEHGPLRLSALAAAVCLDVSTISRQVHDLEGFGWIVRKPDPNDRRASLLELTENGRTVLQTGYEQRRQVLRSILDGWSEDEQAALAAQLARFNQALTGFRKTYQPNDDPQESA